MREIKFRAWDTVKRGWATGEPNHWLAIGLADGEICYVHHSGQVETEQFYPTRPLVLMQYTGLKDKNGKEIYEGDILKAPVDRYILSWNPHYHGDGYYTLQVGFGLVEMGKKMAHVDHGASEVIGNIYENGDLLGGER